MTYQELMDWIATLPKEDKDKYVYIYLDNMDKTVLLSDWDFTVNNDHVGSGYPVLVVD